MKNNTIRRTAAILLAVVTFACTVFATGEYVRAEETPTVYTYGNFRYSVDENGYATIVGLASGIVCKNLVIPQYIAGHPVTAIANLAFLGDTNITSLVISDGVKTIGRHCFKNCTNLTGEVVIPASVTEFVVADNAYQDSYVFENTAITSLVFAEGGEDITIPSGFAYGCAYLEKVTLSSRVKGTSFRSFYYCKSLATINGAENLTVIGQQSFYGCSRLAKFNFSENLTSIGAHAFKNCTSLSQDIFIGAGVTLELTTKNSESYAFENTAITSITFEQGEEARKIPKGIVYGCAQLTEVNLPANTTRIEKHAFKNCAALTAVNVPDSVTYIGYEAFCNSGIKSFVLGERSELMHIAERAFYGAENLEYVVLPENLQLISNSAFAGTSKLGWIAVNDGGNDLIVYDSVFQESTLHTIILPSGKLTFGEDCFQSGGIKEIYFGARSEEAYIDVADSTIAGIKSARIVEYHTAAPATLPAGLYQGFITHSGKSYWYEQSTKQGTYADKKGVLGDGTIRGREIYDGYTNGWYWLDSCFEGAKACNKEVWIPYIYQNEKNWDDAEIASNAANSGDMAAQVTFAIKNGEGKWVRYDAKGKMVKGWYTVEGDQAEIYTNQVGNTYYYDPKTGLMAKGYVTIDGVQYHFDEKTGVLQK